LPRLLLLLRVSGLCLVIITGTNAVAQQTPWIKVERGPAYEVLDDRNQVTVPIPVSLSADTKPQCVRFSRYFVRFGKRFEADLANAFTVPEKLTNDERHAPTLDITVDLQRAHTPGSYFLVVAASNGGGATAQRRSKAVSTQLLEIEIVHLAPKLKPVGTLVIEQTLIPFWTPRIKAAPLELRETSGDSRLTGLSIRPLHFFGSTDEITNGTIEFTNIDANSSIPPGKSIDASYQLKGAFPLGTTKGAAEVDAQQLTESFPVLFEVRTRRTPYLIFLIAAVGLLLGFLSRTVLQKQILLNEARLKANDVEDTLSRELNRPDQTFRRQVQPALDTLIAARNGRDIAVINSAITAATQTLSEQLKQLETRQAEAEALFEQVNSLLTTPWSLPASITQVLANLRDDLPDVRANLDQGAVGESSQTLKDLSQQLINQVTGPVSDFRVWFGNLALLSSPEITLPASVAALLKQAIEAMRPLLQKVTSVSATVTLSELKGIFQAIHDVRVNTRELLLQLAEWLDDALNRVKAELGDGSLAAPEKLHALEARVSALVTGIRNEADNVERALELLSPGTLVELDRYWRDAIEGQMVTFNTAQKKQVTDLLDERKYSEAAAVVAKTILANKAREGSALGGAGKAVAAAHALTPAAAWFPRAQSLETAAGLGVRLLRGGGSFIVPGLTRVQTLMQLALAKFFQFVIIGLGILIVGYLLFADKFVGTFADMAGVFLWAFGLDVTIDAFVGAAKATRSS
jgi:hypothetical protein